MRGNKKKNLFFTIQTWKELVPNAIVAGMEKAKKVTISKDIIKKDGQNYYKYDLFVEGNVFKQVLQIDEVKRRRKKNIYLILII